MEKKPVERVEVTLLLGNERSWKPVVNGQRFVNAVAVMRRSDLRNVHEYVHGWGIFDAKITNPARADVNFVQRVQLGHTDVDDVLRLIKEAKDRVEAAIEKAKNPLAEQISLAFRMTIPNE
jgi:hypothetical protein